MCQFHIKILNKLHNSANQCYTNCTAYVQVKKVNKSKNCIYNATLVSLKPPVRR